MIMEEKFLEALASARQKAQALGIRIRPIGDMTAAHRCLSGHRESDGFWQLADCKRWELTLEAVSLQKEFTALFTDEEANTALLRLMDAGYLFRKA